MRLAKHRRQQFACDRAVLRRTGPSRDMAFLESDIAISCFCLAAWKIHDAKECDAMRCARAIYDSIQVIGAQKRARKEIG